MNEYIVVFESKKDVKTTKSSNFLLKNNNYLLKYYTFNIKCTNSNTNLLF